MQLPGLLRQWFRLPLALKQRNPLPRIRSRRKVLFEALETRLLLSADVAIPALDPRDAAALLQPGAPVVQVDPGLALADARNPLGGAVPAAIVDHDDFPCRRRGGSDLARLVDRALDVQLLVVGGQDDG